MKTILKPAVAEKAQFNCDVTGVPLPNGPATTVKIHCGYGAPYDGDTFELHLSEKAAAVVLPLLRALILGGGPLEPHLTDRLFPGREKETALRRDAAPKLLAELARLVRYRKKVEPCVKRGLAESARGETVNLGSFAGFARKEGPEATGGGSSVGRESGTQAPSNKPKSRIRLMASMQAPTAHGRSQKSKRKRAS